MIKAATEFLGPPAPAEDDPVAIAVRAYVQKAKRAKSQRSKRRYDAGALKPSNVVLAFDTETYLDAAQHLRFGTYQVRVDGRLDEEGLFFDPVTASERDQRTLDRFAANHGLRCRTLSEFIDSVFYGIAYDLGATIVGFNLPFDISRIARGHSTAKTRTMKGGFTFRLSDNPRRGNIQVKMLSGSAPSIRFASPPHRMRRRRGNEAPPSQGHFVDIRALAAALTNRHFSLKSLAEFLNVKHRKLDSGVLAGPLDGKMIEYARRDTQVTWECFVALRGRYDRHGLTGTEIQNVHSVASMGKAYFRQMGIRPWRAVQPNIPPQPIGRIMSAYYGGRSEVHLRRTICRVLYCDFLSMYPTVCTLMQLWPFFIASGMTWRSAKRDVSKFLKDVTLTDLQQPDAWKQLATLVRVQPQADIFPVRAKYGFGQDAHYTIGLNFLSSEEPLWFTLADCIACKLLAGKSPKVIEAIRFGPKPSQHGLRSIMIAGNPEYQIDPMKDDFFRRVIEMRIAIKQQMKSETGATWRTHDVEQEFLKILANSTAYGISVQIDPADFDKRELTDVFGPRDRSHRLLSKRFETPGPYFHPLLGAATTSAARLMLAITERLIVDAGLDWAFCDTDSMAIAKADAVTEGDFQDRVETIRSWFTPLNPYGTGESLLKIEDANFSLDRTDGPKALEPLYCYAVSSKRYALFNLDSGNRPILRKASAHGLGHLRPPNDA
jgi:hypothetical protein